MAGNLVDYHIHTVSHGEIECTVESVEAYLKTAEKRGICRVGFADHDRFLNKVDYTAIACAARRVPKVSVALGVEVDYFPEKRDEILRFVKALDVDYVMGSVHSIGNWVFDHPRMIEGYNAWDIDDLYRAYFDRVRAAAETGLFQIIGHLDVIKVFGFRPKGDVVSYARPALDAIRCSGAAVEINTNGRYKPVGEMYPAQELVRECFRLGIPVTLGSDAHSPENAGRDIDIAARMASDAGYRRLATFKDRTMDFIPL